MQWNFEDSRSDRLLMGSTLDIALFFLAVVLVFVVAVLPTSELASGAAPGEPLLLSSLYLSGPVALLWVGVFLHRRRRATKNGRLSPMPDELTAIYSLVNGLVVIGIGGWLIYGAMNAFFDRGHHEVHFAYVLEKSVKDDGRFENFELQLSDWNSESGTVTLDVASDFFEQIEAEDSCLRLVTRPGAFGHEWIVENQPYKRSDIAVNKDWRYQCRAAWEEKTRLVELPQTPGKPH